MENLCERCRHSKVCIYKQRYQENYTTLKNEIKYDEPFSVELKCKEYESTNIITGNFKDFEVGISPSTINPCEGCGIYEDIKRGKTIIGDMCNFCSKSPIRVGD